MILEKYFEETFSERKMPKKNELLQNLAADARSAAARNFGAEVLASLAGAARENAVWLAAAERTAATSESVGWQNFGKVLLVFGCIGSDFCKKICVLQHFSKSTRFSS